MKNTILSIVIIFLFSNHIFSYITLAPPQLPLIKINKRTVSEQAKLSLRHFRFLIRMINKYEYDLHKRTIRRNEQHHYDDLGCGINAPFFSNQKSDEHIIFALILGYEEWLTCLNESFFSGDIFSSMNDEQLETFISDLTEAIIEAKRYLRLIRSCRFQFRRGLTDKLHYEIKTINLTKQST